MNVKNHDFLLDDIIKAGESMTHTTLNLGIYARIMSLYSASVGNELALEKRLKDINILLRALDTLTYWDTHQLPKG